MNLTSKYQYLYIDYQSTIIDTLKLMDKLNRKLLIVTKSGKFHSIVSIGDLQRAILNGVSLESKIENILRDKIYVAYENDDLTFIKDKMISSRAEFIPIIDTEKNIKQILFWEDIYGKNDKEKSNKINLPVIIMAGGRGTRLRPFTNILPKPLLPVGEKTIIEEIIDRFLKVGCTQFYLSVNFKADTIKHYFKELNSPDFSVNYVQEEKPLGTAGSLFLLKNLINKTFFVSNCDILIEDDYYEILDYHMHNKNELTIVSAIKHYPIPYGIIKTKKEGLLVELNEKPNLIFQINSGFYILEPHLLDEIPENTFFHITSLIKKIQKRKGRVGVFPVSEGSWKDIGTWNNYLKIINRDVL
ncbi:MAG TPA: sugar phosphate nucleotidyltransferase [Ignavibacteriales bacterium]|nr:sugar phosphate nucleotidyltransferase [Ignavibacteriales bacterium]